VLSQNIVSLQPVVIPYNLTVASAKVLLSALGITQSTGNFGYSVALYTFNGGFAGTLSMLTSASMSQSFTSGVAMGGQSGILYRNLATGQAWSMSAGAYVAGIAVGNTNSVSMTLFGPNAGGLALGAQPSGGAFPGYYSTTTAAFPASIAISDTVGYVRSGASAQQQPWFLLQGT
jgi:hypothetical protein